VYVCTCFLFLGFCFGMCPCVFLETREEREEREKERKK